MEAARNVHGRSLKLVAQDIGVTYVTLYKWRNLEHLCPKHRRESVERAFDARIDWELYEKQYHEKQEQRRRAAIQAADANLQADVAKIEQTPVIEAETEPEAQSGGWWSKIIHDDTADAL